MPVTNEKYEQYKIDKLRHFITQMSAKGQARAFEIYVDDLEVVPKTEDPKEFDSFQFYMNEDTEKIRITIYNSGSGQSQYCFTVKPVKPENGLGEIETIIQEKLSEREKQYELNRLKEELEKTKHQLREAEEYVNTLKEALEKESNTQVLKKIKFGELASTVLEGMVRRNPQWLTKVPVIGETLAGIIAQDNADMQQQLETKPAQESQASFKKKSSDTNDQSSQEELQQLALIKELFANFDEPDLQMVWQILEKLGEEPSHIKTVAGLLNIETP